MSWWPKNSRAGKIIYILQNGKIVNNWTAPKVNIAFGKPGKPYKLQNSKSVKWRLDDHITDPSLYEAGGLENQFGAIIFTFQSSRQATIEDINVYAYSNVDKLKDALNEMLNRNLMEHHTPFNILAVTKHGRTVPWKYTKSMTINGKEYKEELTS